MSQITICDQCDNPIEGEPYATMALPGEEDWVVMDVCSKSCVYDLFRLGDDIDEEGEISRVADYDDQLPLFPEPEADEKEETTLKPVKKERSFDPDALLENEKKFKEEAQRISSQMTGVKSRTRGER